VVTVFHGYDLSRYLAEERPGVYRPLFRHGDLFLPVSRHWFDLLLRLGSPASRTHILHMGVDTARFRPGVRTPSKCGQLSILTLGRLVEKKGHADALRAVRLVIDRGHDVRYTIAGDGPLREALASLSEELGIASRIRFLGDVNQEEALKLYRDADVFLLASTSARSGDAEGIPVVLMEAQAIGLPVISTWHSGIPELVRHQFTGLLAAERDVSGLANHLERLACCPDLRNRMGQAGVRVVHDEFNLARQNTKLAAMLESLASHELQDKGT
jgi:colanic acid/amylovoran biosynthesis glycosyltransferase